MGRDELLAALQLKAAAEKQAIWQRAEQQAAEAEAEAVGEQRRLELQRRDRQQQELQELQRALDSRIDKRLQRARLQTEQLLAGRLQLLAGELLTALPPEVRQRGWKVLVEELPARSWQTIRVHPDDFDRARQQFPDSRIESDAALGGGLVAIAADEALQVDNSFERRRQRLWPQLLGSLIERFEAEDGGQSS